MIEKVDTQPWVERYRPQTLDDVYSQRFVIQTLKKFVKTESLPHMIFSGPAGTGKTSAAKAMINDLVGKANLRQDMLLELNASDTVRMSVVREEIKGFVNQKGLTKLDQFKFVLLDEADNIPKNVQQALRRIIELCPPKTKFIMMCNYANRLIDPIISRCAIFRFVPLEKEAVIRRLKEILEKEGETSIDQEVLETLHYISRGDMRQAVNLLQMGVAHDPDTILTSKMLYELSGYILPEQMEKIVTLLKNKEFLKVQQELSQIENFSSRAFITQLYNQFGIHRYKSPKREKFLEILGEFDFRITQGSNMDLQLEGLCASIIEILY